MNYPLTRLEEKKEKHFNRVKNNKEKSIIKRNNRLLSKSLKVLDHSTKSCEYCSIDFKPELPNQRFHNFLCLINFNDENFKSLSFNKEFRGEDWKEKRELCYRRDNGMCKVCGEQIGVDVHHIIPYRETQDNGLSNLICLCSVHHPLEDIYYRKYKRPSTLIIKLKGEFQ